MSCLDSAGFEGGSAGASVGRAAAVADHIHDQLPYLRSLARRLTGNQADAHDLVQDALLRALPALGAVAAGSYLRAWLTTIVRHVHIDRLRRAAREPRSVSIDDAEVECLRCEAVVDVDPDDGMSIEDVEEALGALPEVFRRVFVLHELEGRAYRDIANALDIPLATVGTRLTRARLKLRTLLVAKRAGADRSRASAAPRRQSPSSHSERAVLAGSLERRA
jgi:RNA polymerase sigma-70 factor (ECF subfamily)